MTYDPNRDLFGAFKNPDGAYDGNVLSRSPKDELRFIWEQVKASKEETNNAGI